MRYVSILRGLCVSAFWIAVSASGQDTLGNRAGAPAADLFTAQACPAELASIARCHGGTDAQGSHYLIAKPLDWKSASGTLVVHAHGGPLLGQPRAERVVEDLKRWAIMVKAGYAWVGTSFRQGGVAVQSAALDTLHARELAVAALGQPRRTVLHGQSWGASVAARAAERSRAGARPFDAVLLTSGVLGGGTRSYDFRLDLRVIYQYLCNNHPLPTEAAYPLWMGLPPGSTLTAAELATRTRSCLGLGMPAAQRTPEQARKLKTVVDVLQLRETSLQGHLNWATFHFRDIAQRMEGRSVFGNRGVVYQGSDNDAALNAGVLRYAADPQAVGQFGADTDPTGDIAVPVLTVHAVDDPVAFVELEHTFAQTMARAGKAGSLVQTFTSDKEHSYLTEPLYPALMEVLLQWVDGGQKPTPQTVADTCARHQARFGPGCHVLPQYKPPALDSRVAVRERP
jgi:pimeloyl-ACP methyl ester carboxylesterase